MKYIIINVMTVGGAPLIFTLKKNPDYTIEDGMVTFFDEIDKVVRKFHASRCDIEDCRY